MAAVCPAAGIDIGKTAPDLPLTALNGTPLRLASLQKAPVTVLLFLSAQCPVSNGYVSRLNALAAEFAGRAAFVGINSNHNETAEQARVHAVDYALAFSVYKDNGNLAADTLGIGGTPEAAVLDRQNRLQYRGRIDDSPKVPRVKREDLRLAIEAVLAGRPAPFAETSAFGCSIKRAPK